MTRDEYKVIIESDGLGRAARTTIRVIDNASGRQLSRKSTRRGAADMASKLIGELRERATANPSVIDELGALAASDPGILGGKPCYPGTRVPVQTIAKLLAGGESIERLMEGYPRLTRRQIELAPAWVRRQLGELLDRYRRRPARRSGAKRKEQLRLLSAGLDKVRAKGLQPSPEDLQVVELLASGRISQVEAEELGPLLAIVQARALVGKFARPGSSVVDELIRERHQEACSESAGREKTGTISESDRRGLLEELTAEFDQHLARLQASDARKRLKAVMDARGKTLRRPKAGSSF